MKLFITSWCPYCNQALQLLEQLKNENPAYCKLNITIIDEDLQPEIANAHDYYYVPTFYINDNKTHEGAINKDTLKSILDDAINE